MLCLQDLQQLFHQEIAPRSITQIAVHQHNFINPNSEISKLKLPKKGNNLYSKRPETQKDRRWGRQEDDVMLQGSLEVIAPNLLLEAQLIAPKR